MVVECDPQCGFMVQSHNEEEIMDIAKKHAKMMHNMDATDEQMKEMIKTV